MIAISSANKSNNNISLHSKYQNRRTQDVLKGASDEHDLKSKLCIEE